MVGSGAGGRSGRPGSGIEMEGAPRSRSPFGSWPVSRILSWTAIYLTVTPWRSGRALRPCGLPGTRRAASSSLLGLAPGGVCLAGVSPRRRCALTAPFHPCRRRASRAGPPLRRCHFCGTFPRVSPGRISRPPCPAVSGLSSRAGFLPGLPRLLGQHHEFYVASAAAPRTRDTDPRDACTAAR